MSELEVKDSRASDWGVLHRILTDDGETRILRLRVRNVPDGRGRKELKTALERAGRVFGEGAVAWGNHAVLPRDEWLDLDGAPADTLTFTDLLDEARGEKRVTVRLPIGLHAQLVKAAGGKSFNQFVTDSLAAAIGYEDESIEPSLPRLGKAIGLSAEAMRDKIATLSAKASGPPIAERMRGHFANIAQLPPDQIKAQMDTFYASPEGQAVREMHERLKNGEDIYATLSDEALAEHAKDQGMTVTQLRERNKEAAEKLKNLDFEDALRQMKESSPQDMKDNTLMLRDIFTGRAVNGTEVRGGGNV